MCPHAHRGLLLYLGPFQDETGDPMSYPPPPPPGYGPPPTGAAYLGPPRREPRKPAGLAITSFVLALLGCCAGIVPLIMSWIAMSRVRRGIGGGYALALAAFILSLAWLIATVVGTAILFNLMAKRDSTTGLITEEGYFPPGELRAGDCLDRPGSDPLLVRVVPCSFPHETELITRLPAVPTVPEAEYAALCAPAFRQYVGIAPARSELVLLGIPVAASMFGDASGIACIVGQQGDAEIVGSLRNARR